MKNLTNSKDRHWLIKEEKSTKQIKMYIKHKRDVVMEFTMPELFLKELENNGYILINDNKS